MRKLAHPHDVTEGKTVFVDAARRDDPRHGRSSADKIIAVYRKSLANRDSRGRVTKGLTTHWIFRL